MQWIQDSYTILAGDAAAAWAGRAWSAGRKMWETVSGVPMRAGQPAARPLTLRGIDLRVEEGPLDTYPGLIKTGVYIHLHLVGDPVHPGDTIIPLASGYQSWSNLVGWQGKLPIDAGIQWRIHFGGTIAGDIVSVSVAYE